MYMYNVREVLLELHDANCIAHTPFMTTDINL